MDPGPAADEAPPAEGWRRLRIDLAYDGGPYRGFAPNAGVRTVGGELLAALERVLGGARELVAAGRTDAGVHARRQVVTVEVPVARLDLRRLPRALDAQLGPTIVVRSVGPAPEGLHARFSARSRTYRYRVLNDPVADPLLASSVWHVREPLSVAAMRQACLPLLGEHDFAAFCRRPQPAADGSPASLVRAVLAAEWADDQAPLLSFEIRATAFCHQMVRSIVGTLIDVGRGRRRAADVGAILASADRRRAGSPAPPEGLVLWDVEYPSAQELARPAARVGGETPVVVPERRRSAAAAAPAAEPDPELPFG
jgi:tRNA pseudouridine38-40 synthase